MTRGGVLAQVPSTDIKVISLDEWWLRELQKHDAPDQSQQEEAEEVTSPLLRIDNFFALTAPSSTSRLPLRHLRSNAASLGLASEHWITEVEKGTHTVIEDRAVKSDEPTGRLQDTPGVQTTREKSITIDAQLLAMPHFTDFGLYCVNVGSSTSAILGEQSGDDFLKRLPRLWAKPDGNWFEAPSPERIAEGWENVVDLLFQATESGKAPEKGFVFDLDRGETAVCFLMELAWSFGVEEEFLSRAAIDFASEKMDQSSLSIDALKSALRLLQYLIYHGLMVPFPKADDSRVAILSRQWYSTLNIDTAADYKKPDSVEASTAELLPIPFFPVGKLPSDCGKRRLLAAEIRDIRRHLSGVANRILAALHANKRKQSRFNDDAESNVKARQHFEHAIQRVEEVTGAVAGILADIRSCRKDIGDNFLTTSRLPDDDVLTNVSHKLRLCAHQLLQCALWPESGLSGRQLHWERWGVITDWDHSRRTWRDPENLEKGVIPAASGSLAESDARRQLPWVAAGLAMDIRDVKQMLAWAMCRLDQFDEELKAQTERVVALAGFACSGSWMLGVSRNTHSPGLSWKLIEEMTSRRSNFGRAEFGAGIPSRKDFYEFHGRDKVPRFPQSHPTTWAEFFRQAGAKVRRRDRVVCTKVPLAQLSALMRSSVLKCIDAAVAEQRIDCDRAILPSEDARQRMSRAVDDAVNEILLYVACEQAQVIGLCKSSQPGITPLEKWKRCEFCPRAYQDQADGPCGTA